MDEPNLQEKIKLLEEENKELKIMFSNFVFHIFK